MIRKYNFTFLLYENTLSSYLVTLISKMIAGTRLTPSGLWSRGGGRAGSQLPFLITSLLGQSFLNGNIPPVSSYWMGNTLTTIRSHEKCQHLGRLM